MLRETNPDHCFLQRHGDYRPESRWMQCNGRFSRQIGELSDLLAYSSRPRERMKSMGCLADFRVLQVGQSNWRLPLSFEPPRARGWM